MYSSDSISFRTQTMSVERLLDGIANHHIVNDAVVNYVAELSPRRSSDYIESVIVGLPLLPLVLDGSKSPWGILDGIKRLSAIWAFANNQISLETVNYSRLHENIYFHEMNPYLRNRFLRSQIPCYIINPGTPKDIIDDIERRIRTNL